MNRLANEIERIEETLIEREACDAQSAKAKARMKKAEAKAEKKERIAEARADASIKKAEAKADLKDAKAEEKLRRHEERVLDETF